MTKINLKLSDGTELNKKLTWGIHRELSNYLMEDNALMVLFTDSSVSEMVLQICLSERNETGEVTKSFHKTNDLDVDSMLNFLQELHDYFEDFFFQNQQRMLKTQKKIQSLQDLQATEN